MADENDTDRPEDDLPTGQPGQGDNVAEPVEAATSEPATPDHHAELFEETEAEAEAAAPPLPEQLPPIPEDLPIAAQAYGEEPRHEEVAAPKPAPASRPDELPSQFFRAAGDPEEAQEEPPASLVGRLQGRVTGTARDAWRAVEPKWVAFAGGARAFGGEIWRRIREIGRAHV